MAQKRRLLIVEDSPMQYELLRLQTESEKWAILRAGDEASALRQMEQAVDEDWPIEVVAVDLGLPPGADNPMRGGVPLIEKLRQWQENLPILAYTSIPPTSTDYAYLVARFLPLRVSFIYLRPMIGPPSFAEMVEIVWKGFFVLSPAPTDQLPIAVADKPDPLSDDQWETLELLSSNLAYKEIAANLDTPVTKDAVKVRISKIKDILYDAGHVPFEHADIRDVVDWYLTHYVRYRRFPKTPFRR